MRVSFDGMFQSRVGVLSNRSTSKYRLLPVSWYEVMFYFCASINSIEEREGVVNRLFALSWAALILS